MRFALVLLLLAASAAVAAPPAAAPVYWRLAVIDMSGSMDGKPLAEVRRELTAQLQQVPVSVPSPITFLTFSTVASPPVSFDNQAAALKYISTLNSGVAGTSISAGLQAALRELKARANLAGVALMLYTDDQDSDRTAIKAAETELDQLFRQRSEQGLSQAVYLRSWSTAGAMSDLLAVLGKRPYVAVAESATEGQIAPVRVTPKVKIDQAEVVSDQAVRVKFRMYVDAQVPKGWAAPALRFELREAAAKSSWAVTALAPPVAGEAELALDATTLSAGQTVLRLAVLPQPTPPSGQGRVLPLLAATLLEIPVPLQITRELEIAGKLIPTGKVRWDPRDPQSVIYEFKCGVGIRKVGHLDFPGTIRLKLRDAGAWRLEGGPQAIEVKSQSAESRLVEASTTLTAAELNSSQPPAPATLALAVDAPPAGVKFLKDVVRLASSPLPPPPKTTTQVEVALESVSPALWYELPDIAVFRVELRVSSTGPMPPDAKFLVVSPAEVHQLRLDPPTLQTGRQTVHMDVAARVKPGPATTALQFTVTPPAPTPLVRISCTERFQVDVTGPLPAQLNPVAAWNRRSTISLTAPIDASVAEGNFAASLSGPVTERFANGLRWQLDSSPPAVDAGPAVGLSGTATCRLSLTRHEAASYFRDRVDGFPLRMELATPSVAVLAGGIQCEVVRQAPFKRHLLIAAATLAVILTPWIAYRLLRSLRLGDDGSDLGKHEQFDWPAGA